MKKSLLLSAGFLMLGTTLFAQRTCSQPDLNSTLLAEHPEFAAKMAERKATMEVRAKQYIAAEESKTAGKTTATVFSPIPVIFHVIVSSTQLAQIGGTAGVAKRCDSQIAVLNRDYNRKNSDSTLIPSGWKSLYKSSGIKFGAAHRKPNGRSTPGYEILTTNAAFVSGTYGDYHEAKHSSTGGLDAWDNTKYLNVWCIYFSDNTSLLGVATPPALTISGGGPIDDANRGACVNYAVFGKRTSSSDFYQGAFDLGRTLTHEIGHYFELRHTWGDDGGACPWPNPMDDDGLSDTPPESNATYNNPTYSITGGTLNDGCKMNGSVNTQPYGIPCLDFMDYTDDKAMHMFTTMQVALMASNVLSTTGESFSLTQNPTLLQWPTEITNIEANTELNVFPNPTNGVVNISFNEQADQLNEIVVTNTLGQQIEKIDGSNVKNGNLSVDLSAMSKGIYFVTCNFASGSTTQKILLQ